MAKLTFSLHFKGLWALTHSPPTSTFDNQTYADHVQTRCECSTDYQDEPKKKAYVIQFPVKFECRSLRFIGCPMYFCTNSALTVHTANSPNGPMHTLATRSAADMDQNLWRCSQGVCLQYAFLDLFTDENIAITLLHVCFCCCLKDPRPMMHTEIMMYFLCILLCWFSFVFDY